MSNTTQYVVPAARLMPPPDAVNSTVPAALGTEEGCVSVPRLLPGTPSESSWMATE